MIKVTSLPRSINHQTLIHDIIVLFLQLAVILQPNGDFLHAHHLPYVLLFHGYLQYTVCGADIFHQLQDVVLDAFLYCMCVSLQMYGTGFVKETAAISIVIQYLYTA